ncbi:MAG: hypothetical protein PF638_06805 [Candidatus Delongbacteria bacterium]|jgi:hypothetical protein|nr:hypothetical protein [Candidatus Delongbacteria bacterium]
MGKNIVFLYLNGTHQLFHSAMTAFELARMQTDFNVQLIACHIDHYDILNSMKESYPESKCQIILLPLPFRFKYFNFKKKTYPSPYSTIKKAKEYLKDAVTIVTTSHILPKLLKKINVLNPKVIYQFHGCGDRKYSFDPEYKYFDLLLAPGSYHKQRLLAENIVSEDKIEIIGYPKLDIPLEIKSIKKSLFNNNNKIFLYTPHWDPKLSSYKIWGEEVINYFKINNQYNLIFAPHVQLKHWQYKCGYNTNLDHLRSENIHIDFGSLQSVDGTYTNISDIYIGDVSSQIYEFIALQPKPAIFLNPNNFKWQNNIDFKFWELGIVIENISELEKAIQLSYESNALSELQQKRIDEYINITDEKSSVRAAETILKFTKLL